MRSVYLLLFIFIFPFFVGGTSAQTYYTITTIAGTGAFTYSGDSGLATSASFETLGYMTTDKKGNIYITDYNVGVIRKIDKITNIIYTIAGTGINGSYNGDGIDARTAKLYDPSGIIFGISGEDTNSMFVCDFNNYRIRKINSLTNIIGTIAGKDTAGYSGDGGPAIMAKLYSPAGICADKNKNIYFTDYNASVIRKIDAVTGYISTIAGTGTRGYSGDGGAATSATLNGPIGIQLDKHGNIYFCDGWNNVVRRIDSATGTITTVAGDGYLAGTHSGAFGGDSGLATAARLNTPSYLQINDKGDLFICDQKNNRIRKVDGTTGIIITIAGTGGAGFSGDGGLATNAKLRDPSSICLVDSGIIYITDANNFRIRKLTPHDTSVNVPAVTSSEQLSIYPNPVKNTLQFVVSNREFGSDYIIVGVNGRELMRAKIIAVKQTIDVSKLQPGNYFIQVMNKEGDKQSVRFVKEE